MLGRDGMVMGMGMAATRGWECKRDVSAGPSPHCQHHTTTHANRVTHATHATQYYYHRSHHLLRSGATTVTGFRTRWMRTAPRNARN